MAKPKTNNKGESMKYTLVKRVKFSGSTPDMVSVITEADSLEDALKYKVGAEMLAEKEERKDFEILININDTFTYINAQPEKPLMLVEEVKGKAS